MNNEVSESNTSALVACTVALVTLVPVALFQTGMIPKLPDPPGALFASEKITTSKDAHPLGIPDGILGLGSYAATLTLILLARKSPAATKLLGAKFLLDGGMAGFNVVRQIVSFGKICSWCTGTAIATAVMVWSGRDMISRTHKTIEDLAAAGLDLQPNSTALNGRP